MPDGCVIRCELSDLLDAKRGILRCINVGDILDLERLFLLGHDIFEHVDVHTLERRQVKLAVNSEQAETTKLDNLNDDVLI